MEDGTQLDIEMQVAYFQYWDKRVLFYLSKMFTEQQKKDESYENLKKCIHVSILDFIHFPEDDECYRKIHFYDEKMGKRYTDLMEIQILELKKLPKEAISGGDVIDWMRFFSGRSREEFEDMAKTNEYLKEAYDTLEVLSADEKKRLEYEAREKALMDYNTQMSSARKSGLQLGIKQGIEQGVTRTKKIFRLHMQGKEIDAIARECDVTVEEVEELLFGDIE